MKLEKKRTALLNAILNESRDAIAVKQRELVNAVQIDCFTPLHYACHRGNLKILKLLVSYGGDVHATSKNGVTCLHLASVSGNLEVVKYLLDEHGCEVRVKSTASGSEPIHVAASAGHLHVVEYLVTVCRVSPLTEDVNRENALTLAIKNRKREVAIWLINLNQFALNEIIPRRGFNYFAYALVKGQ